MEKGFNRRSTNLDTDGPAIKVDNLLPRGNAVGGFVNRGYSNLEILDGSNADLDVRRESRDQTALMRFLCLSILSLSGGIVSGVLTSVVVDGWAIYAAASVGGFAGLILAALFWAS